MSIVHLSLAPDDIRSDLTAETNARIAADAAIIASGADPGNVGIAPVIATGSVQVRTVADRFADVVNVKDFGAAGDGVTDDTVAIQAAIDEGKTVVFQPGTYLLSGALVLSSGHRLVGARANSIVSGGTGGVTLLSNTSITMIKSNTVDSLIGDFTYDIRIEDMMIVGDGAGTTAIEIGNATAGQLAAWTALSHVTVRRCLNGLKVNGSAYGRMSNCVFYGLGSGSSGTGIGLLNCQHMLMDGVVASDYCVDLDVVGDGLRAVGCQFYTQASNTVEPLHLVRIRGGGHNLFLGCQFENLFNDSTMDEVAIYATTGDFLNTTSNTFIDCWWNGKPTPGHASSGSRLRIGKTGEAAAYKTHLQGCTFLYPATTDIEIQSSEGLTLTDCYRVTSYDGTDFTRPVVTGTDAKLRIIDDATNSTGTWTPTLYFGGATTGITYTIREGTWARHENILHFRARILLSSKGSATGAAAIDGLSPNSIAVPTACMVQGLADATDGAVKASSGQVDISVYQGGGHRPATNADFANTTELLISGFYEIA